MGATVLSAQNPMASELLMVPVVNDGVMVVEGQETVPRTSRNIQIHCAREINSLNKEKEERSVVTEANEDENVVEIGENTDNNEQNVDDHSTSQETVSQMEPMTDEEYNMRKQFKHKG